MFSKRLAELTADDIRDVIERGAQEDSTVELKEALATRDGSPDSWMRDQNSIGNDAKKDLSKELIAFANAEGGTLILGIAEDGEKRASSIKPIPDCRKLADRLAQSIASTSDPKLTNIEFAGVPTENDGSGVCVFRVPQSHRAPHRDTYSRECYTRIGDRSEPMPMRQIQDLVLQRSRGLSSVMEELDRRSAAMRIKLDSAIAQLGNGNGVMLNAVSMRATAFPLEDVYVPRIHMNRAFKLPSPHMISDGKVGRPEHLADPESREWQPMLRGIRSNRAAQDSSSINEDMIRSDGLIECTLHMREDYLTNATPIRVGLSPWFPIKVFARLLVTVEAFRIRYGRPDMEFALDFEWRFSSGAKLLLHRMGAHGGNRTLEPIERINRVMNYEMPPREGLSDLLSMLNDDIGASCGGAIPHVFGVDFEHAINNVLTP